MNIIYFFFISVVDLFALGYIYKLIKHNSLLTNKQHTIYLSTIFVIAVIIISEIGANFCDTQNEAYANPNIFFNVTGFLLSPFIPLILSSLFIDFSNKKKYLFYLPILINTLAVLCSPFTGWVFYVTPENYYIRGPLFFIFILSFLYGMILLLCSVFFNKEIIHIQSIYITSLFIALLIGASTQIIEPELHTNWHTVTTVIILFYLYMRESQFRYDSLTRCLNRQAYNVGLTKLEQSGSGTVIMLDLDNFKSINDTYGHLNGDLCLKTIGGILNNSFQSFGDCYRIGGDEFCVITSSTDTDVIRSKLDLMKVKIKNAQQQHEYITSVSFGFSIFDDSTKRIHDIITSADKCMYEHKFTSKKSNQAV